LRNRAIGKNGQIVTSFCSKPYFFTLSKREKELFSNIGHGMSMDECCEKMELTKKSADNLKTRLMAKLDVHSVSKIVFLASKNGLLNEY